MVFQGFGQWNGGIEASQSLNGGIEVLKAVLRNPSSDVRCDASGERIFGKNEYLSGGFYLCGNFLFIPGEKGSKINDAAAEVVFFDAIQGFMDPPAVGDDAKVVSMVVDCGFSFFYEVRSGGYAAAHRSIQ
jgi:hypothetical protein